MTATRAAVCLLAALLCVTGAEAVPRRLLQQAAAGAQQQSSSGTAQQGFSVALAPGTTVSYQQQPGFPRVSATTPGNSVTVEHTQNSSDPQAVFKLGPQSEPVQVTVGRQVPAGGLKELLLPRQVGLASGLVEQQPASDQNDPNPLSGSLHLGKWGVTQENGYEHFQVGRDGASLTTPFSKVEVPGTYITDPAATRQAFAALQAAALPALQSLQPAKDLAAALAPAAALLADAPAPAAAP